MGQRLLLAFTGIHAASLHMIQITAMLVFMAIDTEVFPVAPVGRIIVVIVVLVMDREHAKILTAKFASTPRTDPGVHLKRLLPITLLPLAPGLGSNPVQPIHV